MENKKMKHRKFIEIYEKNIKSIRDEYYKNIITSNSTRLTGISSINLTIFIALIAVFLIIVFNFNYFGYILGILIIAIGNIILKLVDKTLHINNQKVYPKEIRKLGYFSIEDYEAKIKEYITGPGGYYEMVLNDIKEQYNITDQIRKISGAKGEEYYIWLNQDQSQLNLLNNRTTERPEIISINMGSVRYFRIDTETQTILLKTDMEYYHFNLNALDILNEIMKNKRYDVIKTFNPEEYINDFEIFMHSYKSKLSKKLTDEQIANSSNTNQMILYLILIIVANAIKLFISLGPLLDVIAIIMIILFNYSINESAKSFFQKPKSDEDYLTMLANEEECQEKFKELKFALGIREEYDKIYSKDGACYFTWIANGYFHVFLNVIYFNVIYMSINMKDIKYFKATNHECTIKLTDKTLEFRSDAKETLAKILPNKDYDWLKGYQ